MHVQVDAITWDLGSHHSQFQHLQYLGASAETQASFAQLHAMAYQSFLPPQGLQADSPATHLAWDSLSETGRRFHEPLPRASFMSLKPEPCGQHCQVQ